MSDSATVDDLRAEVTKRVGALDAARKAKAEAGRAGAEVGELRAAIDVAEAELFEATRALAIREGTGGDLGVVTMGDEIVGVIAVVVPPGSGSDARSRAIDMALASALADRASELGGIVAAEPARYTRERPGRDAEGRTVLDVRGRLEGDRVVPAIPTSKRRS